MANVYGPMTRPATPGISLNTRPQFQMPAAAPVAPVAAAPAAMPSFQDWMGTRNGGYHSNPIAGGRDQRLSYQQKQMQQMRAKQTYLEEMMRGGVAPAAAAAPSGRPAGLLSMDPVAMAYATFLNGRA